jgi:two-component system, LuxR family, sensor kinase FixL
MFSRDTLAVMEAAVDAVVVIDHRGRMQAVNAATCRAFGYRTDEMLGQNVSMLMPEPDRSRHDDYLARYRESGDAHIIGIGRDVIAQRRDGSRFPVRLSVGRVPGTEPARFVGLMRDITEEQTASAEIRMQRDRARAYLELHDSILLELDPEHRIREIGANAAERLGGSAACLIGRDWLDFMSGDPDRDRARQLLADAASHSSSRDREFDCVDLDGTARRILWRCIALRGENGASAGWLCSGIDVTARMRAKQEALRAKERLTQVAQLATAGEMAAGLAHEINQPLTAITTYAQVCERLLDAPQSDLGEIRAALREIAAEGLRAGDIIRRLRRMVRLDTPDTRTRVDANSLIEELRSLLESDARAHAVRLNLELSPRLPAVVANGLHLQQVVLNLARNAFDAMLENAPGNRQLTVRTASSGDQDVEIQVDDSGPGIDPAIADRLFEPFSTTKRAGTGLGLAMSRTIVQSHGGTIGTHPLSPHGTRFFIRLPASEETVA